MIKKIIFPLLLPFLITIPVHSEVIDPKVNAKNNFAVKYQINKVHCLYNFLEALSGRMSGSKTLREEFEKSKYNNDKYQSLIKEFQDFNLTQYSYILDNHAQSRTSYQNAADLFVVASASSNDINYFSQRTIGFVPFVVHKRLIEIMKEFEPVYNDLVWFNSKADLTFYKNTIENKSENWHLSELFYKTLKFYDSQWPDNIPFIVSFYPIPDARGHSTATPNGNVETVGVLSKSTDYEGSFGIMFHEMCHSLFSVQSPEKQIEIEKEILNSKSKYALYAYKYMDEGLATAIGNGWAYSKAAGNLDKTKWYSDKYINNFAQALYPLVSAYIENNKTIDSVFINEFVSVFEKTFPDAIYEYENLFSSIAILTNAQPEQKKLIKMTFRKNFRIASFNMASPVLQKDSLEYLSDKLLTKIVIIKNDETESLNKIISEYNLEDKKTLLAENNNYIYNYISDTGNTLILIKLDDYNNIAKYVKTLNNNKFINLKSPLVLVK